MKNKLNQTRIQWRKRPRDKIHRFIWHNCLRWPTLRRANKTGLCCLWHSHYSLATWSSIKPTEVFVANLYRFHTTWIILSYSYKKKHCIGLLRQRRFLDLSRYLPKARIEPLHQKGCSYKNGLDRNDFPIKPLCVCMNFLPHRISSNSALHENLRPVTIFGQDD